MKKILFLFVFFLVIGGWTVDAFALASKQLQANWDEPTKNADTLQTILGDLGLTTLYYNSGTGDIKVGEYLAAPGGGMSHSITFTVTYPDGTMPSVKVWLTATDISGNVSVKSNEITNILDSLPPKAPVLKTVIVLP